jgi:hypothetical protein
LFRLCDRIEPQLSLPYVCGFQSKFRKCDSILRCCSQHPCHVSCHQSYPPLNCADKIRSFLQVRWLLHPNSLNATLAQMDSLHRRSYFLLLRGKFPYSDSFLKL